MKPRRTILSNGVFKLVGGNEDNDLWVQKVLLQDEDSEAQTAAIRTTWDLTPEERRAIGDGANIELQTVGAGTPPLSMRVIDTPLGRPDGGQLEAPW